MSRGLRYASEAELPESMRRLMARTELRETRRAHAMPALQSPPTVKPARHNRQIEHDLQVEFFRLIHDAAHADAGLLVAEARTHAIPNGGARGKAEAGRLKAEGVRAGVPDVFCALPAHGKHGLYIEMKTGRDAAAKIKDGKVSPAQAQWLDWSEKLGYATAVCRSATEAFGVWHDYVEGYQDP